MASRAPDSLETPPRRGERGHKPRERRCVARGIARDPDNMIRFVRAPDGIIVPDVFRKLPGRGVWVSATEADLRHTLRKGGFKRGFKTNLAVDAKELIEQTRLQLRRRFLGQVTMARKAKRLVFGETAVREAGSRGDIALRIEAEDGAADGRGRLRTLALATARELDRPDPKVVGCLTAEEIGAALGREPVVHAALLVGPMQADLIQSAEQLGGFERLIPDHWTDKKHEPRWKGEQSAEDGG